jgi:sugar lactone lactonase YvrE
MFFTSTHSKSKRMKPNINKLLLSIFLLTSIGARAQPSIISTIAGNGSYGYSGDGGQATAAKLSAPDAVAVGDSGAVYIVQSIDNVVRKIKPSGIIVTIAGNGTSGYSGDGAAATMARLTSPADVAVDTAGNVYIADLGNNVVRRVSKTGIITTVAGSNMVGFSGDNGPATAAKLSSPAAIAVDTFGNLYIADLSNNRVRKVNAAGIITTFAGTGTSGFSGDGLAATSAAISSISGIAADRLGNVFITDQVNNRIRKINATGIISTVAGMGTAGYSGDGGPATAAQFQYPNKIAVDTKGNLYVGDGNNNVVRKIGVNDTIYTFAGKDSAGYSGDGGIATNAKLSNPRGVAVDTSGKVYIADAGNDRIRRAVKKNIVFVQEIESVNPISVFPNPGKGEFRIIGDIDADVLNGPVQLSITNVAGQLIYKSVVPYHNGIINAHIMLNSDVPEGMYLLNVTAGAVSQVSRLIIQR